MASFDNTISINASPEVVWLAVKKIAAQDGEISLEKEGSLLVIRRGNNSSLVYFLQAHEHSPQVKLRHVVTNTDINVVLQVATDIPAALDALPGNPTEMDSLEVWPARRRMNGIMSAAEGRAPITFVQKASSGRRFLAYVIDGIILGFVNGIIPSVSGSEQIQERWSVLSGIIALAIPAIYFIWFYSTSGETLGKRALGIRVVSMDGSPLNWRKGILRTIGYVLSAIPLGVGFLWAIWDSEKQAGHDKIAGTCVVPVSVTREQLEGTIHPSEVRRTQRRWLLGLGIPALIIAAGGFFLFWRGMAEVSEMGPWPDRKTAPEELITLDLSHLGLELGDIQSARDEETWAGGGYEEGILITYELRKIRAVVVWALRYETLWSAANDYRSVQAAAESGCQLSAFINIGNAGIMHCDFGSGYQKLFWNDYWIVSIVAMEGRGFSPASLVDQVRDAITIHWRTIVEPQ